MRITKRLLEYRKLEARKWNKIDKVVERSTVIIAVILITLIILALWIRG